MKALAACDDLDVRVCASRTVPGIDDLSSEETGDKYCEDLDHLCTGMMGNRLYWQHKLRLDPDLESGDVLVVNGNPRFLSNIPLIWSAKSKQVGVVWWSHGFPKPRRLFRDAIRRVFLHFADVILLYTDKEVEEFRQLGFPAKKLFATNNAIDEAPIRKAIMAWEGEPLMDFKDRENIAGKRILLFCGRRTGSVSLELVFNALTRLRKVDGNILFAIIGPEDNQDDLKRRTVELGVDDCVRWLGPMFEQHDLAPWFLSASCLVFPGSIGLSLIHALAYGLPVIVPNCPHGPEIAALRDGENGLLFRDGDVEDLTRKISSVIEHPEYHQKLSDEALRTVESDYNMENMAQRYREAMYAAIA